MTITVRAMSLAEYSQQGRPGRRGLVADHLRDDPWAKAFYRPARAAIRRAVGTTDPAAEFTRELPACSPTQAAALTAVATGFVHWLTATKGEAVPTATATCRIGGLSVTVAPDFALRTGDGGLIGALAYLKEPPLTLDAANIALRLLQRCMPSVLPGGTPVVVDTRRGRAFRLSRSVSPGYLDAHIEAEAASYSTLHRLLAA